MKKGTFKIQDPAWAQAFWSYFIDDKIHTFFQKEEGERIRNTPVSEMFKPQ